MKRASNNRPTDFLAHQQSFPGVLRIQGFKETTLLRRHRSFGFITDVNHAISDAQIGCLFGRDYPSETLVM